MAGYVQTTNAEPPCLVRLSRMIMCLAALVHAPKAILRRLAQPPMGVSWILNMC